MQYRRLGRTGLHLSALSFGAWLTFGQQVGRGVARDLVAAAWDNGINFFDNAEVYARGEAERVMGDVIADLRLPRDGFCVSSKVFFGSATSPRPTQRGLSRKHVFDACHDAMRRLRVDYLDLYFCHRPDPDTSIEETVRAMDALVGQGKVMYWGTSEWPAGQIESAHAIAREGGWHAPAMEQPQHNLFERERVEVEYASLYARYGMGTTIWSPLASGLLSGKHAAGIEPGTRFDAMPPGMRGEIEGTAAQARLRRTAAFMALASELGVAPAPLAIAWCLRNPAVSTVMLGASKVEQLVQNMEALELAGRIGDATWDRVEAAIAA